MSDSPTAREEAERIAAPFNRGVACGILTRHSLADAIEFALLAYGRRERAQGMRDAAVMCADLGSERERNCIPETADQASSEAAMLRLCARRVEHRARETEGVPDSEKSTKESSK